jgi:hypothetical protein
MRRRRAKGHALRRRYSRSSCPVGSEVQSLLFPRSKFTVSQASEWAGEHGFKVPTADVTGQTIRLRQLSPDDFKRLRTQAFGHTGIKAVIGWKTC